MELDARTKLLRFCFLGRFDPVYVHLRSAIDVQLYWPQIRELCLTLDDDAILLILRRALLESKLVRRNESIFVYAAYFASNVAIGWKTAVRKSFPELIQTDEDLFMFCKYTALIQRVPNRTNFTKTIRKAITSWYESRSPEELQTMWSLRRGGYGFTHKDLLRICHISDEIIGVKAAASMLFKPSGGVSNQSDPSIGESSSTADFNHVDPVKEESKEVACLVVKPESGIEELKKLHTTTNVSQALKIIRKYELNYNQVPKQLFRHSPIMEELIPNMSYLQLLKCWRDLVRFNHFSNIKIRQICQDLCQQKRTLRKDNIHPIVFLMYMRRLNSKGDFNKMQPKKLKALNLNYLELLYMQSFKNNEKTGLRMHITINLQGNYRERFLKNLKKIKFLEASVVLSFGYFMKENEVDVFYWSENKNELIQLNWTKNMDVEDALKSCEAMHVQRNEQRLVTPVLRAMPRDQEYDVFLSIVPTAGRGNPNNSSLYLYKFLDRYREKRNPKAKYVILNLLKYHKSMKYSETRNENILEICGLDEHTTDLINSFSLNRFY